MKLALAFLWHMHQPFYKDILTNSYTMPWVRLHSTKAYYDMITILENYPKIKMNFNLVPSLIVQVQDYIDGKAIDAFLLSSQKPAAELEPDEKKFILWNFFMANWDTMIKPYPRYWELLLRRGTKASEDDINKSVLKFTVDDFRDLQVWFNMTWFGFSARTKYPEIQELINKGRDFTEKEKEIVLSTQIKVMKELLPSYKKYQDKKQIEITTTPFYHPIMPLIYDTDIAKRSMPWALLPQRFSAPEDVDSHIKLAIELYKRNFGTEPKGMWPSEGSVCPEIVPIIAKNGIQWIATDEEILLNSITAADKGDALYKIYKFIQEGSALSIIFRDKGLSNAISFKYSKQKQDDAVCDFMLHLNNIYAHVGRKKNEDDAFIASVILDGENPWEYYPEGGRIFLSKLFDRLSDDSNIYTTTVSEYLENVKQRVTLPKLYSGSWINHDFDIWIGDKEENTAWNNLKKAKEFIKAEENKKKLSKHKLSLAYQNLYAAEGSDWFWWYGDDFFTDCDEEFDSLFRMHLGNVYKVLGYDIPEYLKEPIIYIKEVHANKQPISFISPSIDGICTHYYEWSDAGFFEAARRGRTLYKSEGYLSGIFFGFDMKNMYIRIDPSPAEGILKNNISVYFSIIEPKEYQIVFPFSLNPEDVSHFTLNKSNDGINYEKIRDYESIRVKEIIEFSLPFNDLGLKPKDAVHFFVQIKKENKELDRYPVRGYISFNVPDKDFEMEDWNA